tara:strand:+ start:195 stop:410 length:216 start_codon:yes stop_codon:yes gene_type:complete
MSAEKIVSTEEHSLVNLKTPNDARLKFDGRVDINDLIARVREEKKKENKVNFVFFGLFSSLILVVGIILAL